MNIKKEVTIKANFKCFQLASFIKEDSIILEFVREYIKTGDKKIYNVLISKGFITGMQEVHNIVPTVGRNVLARLLAGDVTYSGEIDYGALGDAVSPSFTNSDTQLGNEVYRKQAASQAFDDNLVYIDWFIASGDVADGTFTEFGAFIDGTGAADSGQAFSLLATGGWVKSGSIFISAQYTLT